MAFESVRRTKQAVSKSRSEALLSLTICNDAPLKDGTIPRVMRYAISEELMVKYNMYENNIDVLIDGDSNQGMIRVDKNGFVVNIPKSKTGKSGRNGYVRARLHKSMESSEDCSGVEVKIISFLNDGFVFALPSKQGEIL